MVCVRFNMIHIVSFIQENETITYGYYHLILVIEKIYCRSSKRFSVKAVKIKKDFLIVLVHIAIRVEAIKPRQIKTHRFRSAIYDGRKWIDRKTWVHQAINIITWGLWPVGLYNRLV